MQRRQSRSVLESSGSLANSCDEHLQEGSAWRQDSSGAGGMFSFGGLSCAHQLHSFSLWSIYELGLYFL